MLTQNRQKLLAAAVIAIVFVLAAIALSPKDDAAVTTAMVAQDESPAAGSTETAEPEETAANVVEIPVESVPKSEMSKDGLYTAECLVNGGTMIGQVDVSKSRHPSQLEKIDIKNMNTGKETTVALKDANCTFIPISEK